MRSTTGLAIIYVELSKVHVNSVKLRSIYHQQNDYHSCYIVRYIQYIVSVFCTTNYNCSLFTTAATRMIR